MVSVGFTSFDVCQDQKQADLNYQYNVVGLR